MELDETNMKQIEPIDSVPIGYIARFQHCIGSFFTNHSKIISTSTHVLAVLGYFIYFAFALLHDFEEANVLFIGTCVVTGLVIYSYIRDCFGPTLKSKVIIPLWKQLMKVWPRLRW